MPINKTLKLNGFSFTFTTMLYGTQFVIDPTNPEFIDFVENGNLEYSKALKQIIADYEEISSVLFAEESLGMWGQGYSDDMLIENYEKILASDYSSPYLKEKVFFELNPNLKNEEEPPQKVKKRKLGFIYLIKAKTGECKIGYSTNVQQRLKSFQSYPPFKYTLIHHFPSDDMDKSELFLHEKYSQKNIQGEWFNLSDSDISDLIRIEKFDSNEFYYKNDVENKLV